MVNGRNYEGMKSDGTLSRLRLRMEETKHLRFCLKWQKGDGAEPVQPETKCGGAWSRIRPVESAILGDLGAEGTDRGCSVTCDNEAGRKGISRSEKLKGMFGISSGQFLKLIFSHFRNKIKGNFKVNF